MIQLRQTAFPADLFGNTPELGTQRLFRPLFPKRGMVNDILLHSHCHYMAIGSRYFLGDDRQKILFLLCPPAVVIQCVMVITEGSIGKPHSPHRAAHLLRGFAHIIVPAVNRAAVDAVMMQIPGIIAPFPQMNEALQPEAFCHLCLSHPHFLHEDDIFTAFGNFQHIGTCGKKFVQASVFTGHLPYHIDPSVDSVKGLGRFSGF